MITKIFYHFSRLSPIGNNKIINLSDPEIRAYYSSIMYSLFNYYRPASNFYRIWGFVEGLRKSCHLTLAMKHKKHYAWAVKNDGYDVNLQVSNRKYDLPPINCTANVCTKFIDNDKIFDINSLFTKGLQKKDYISVNAQSLAVLTLTEKFII